MHLVIPIIEATLVLFPGLVLSPAFGLDHIFFIFVHELSEGLVDDGLKFVEFCEDEGGKFPIVVEKVSKGEGNMMSA